MQKVARPDKNGAAAETRIGSGDFDRDEPGGGPHGRDLGRYRPLVKQIALQVASGIPRHVELDELISAGTVGLVEAARRFDPARGVRFEAYVSDRIRGAIIDFLRSLDWAPRSIRAAGKQIDEARIRLANELGRQPSEAEIARETGTTVDRYRSVRDSITQSSVLTLDRAADDSNDDDGDTGYSSSIPDENAPAPDEQLERKELYGYLADAVNCLPEQSRTVIALYYIEGMHMAAIGEVLGVTQSRASQIHSSALAMLRDAISMNLDTAEAENASTQTASDTSNRAARPRGRRARRLAKFYDSVADASGWRERLDPGKSINISFESIVAGLDGSVESLGGMDPAIAERWQRLVERAREVSEPTREREPAPS